MNTWHYYNNNIADAKSREGETFNLSFNMAQEVGLSQTYTPKSYSTIVLCVSITHE